ncbi:MAG: molecular chaperone DnaJ [Bacteroidales bacterium]|jgi:molecular chaperone DnaJ|nr:molecular chaperone DnaJ [Bacteroidales bacterium]
MDKKDFYEVLGVAKTATTDEIKKAYRKKAMEFHPDKNPGNKEAEEKFKEAAEAYDILGNQEKRAKYDRFGHEGFMNSGASGYSHVDFDLGTIFEKFGDIFSGGFSGFDTIFNRGGGGGYQQQRRVRKGSNLRITVKLTLEEIATGVEKNIKLKKQVACNTCHGTGTKSNDGKATCQTCHGSGQVLQTERTVFGLFQQASTCSTCQGTGEVIKDPCPACKGQGVVAGEEIVTVTIPAGVASGMQLSIRDKGNAAPHGGINGDLLVVIEEIPHALFEREGLNLYLNYFISFPQAVSGASVEIPTIDGKAKIKIQPGTQSGHIVRLRGKGLPDVQRMGHGDLIVNINVWTPKTLSKEEKAIIEKFMDAPNFAPKPDKSETSFFSKIRNAFK